MRFQGRAVFALFFSVAASCATISVAATYSVSVTGSSCFESQTGDRPQIAFCTHDEDPDRQVGARAEAGNMGVAAAAFLAYDADGQRSGSFASSASGSFTDLLEFGIPNGVFTLDVDFRGSISSNVPDPGRPRSSTASLSWGVQGGSRTYGYATEVATGADGSRTTVSGEPSDSLEFPFSDGRLTLTTTLSSRADCGNIANRYGEFNFCQLQTMGMDSLLFTGATVRDRDGNLVADAFLGASSGFDYLSGYSGEDGGPAPAPGPAPVPLPAPLLLLAASLAGAGTFLGRSSRIG